MGQSLQLCWARLEAMESRTGSEYPGVSTAAENQSGGRDPQSHQNPGMTCTWRSPQAQRERCCSKPWSSSWRFQPKSQIQWHHSKQRYYPGNDGRGNVWLSGILPSSVPPQKCERVGGRVFSFLASSCPITILASQVGDGV